MHRIILWHTIHGRGRWERGEDSCEMRRFAERMRQGVGFGRQVVPVGRLWGRIPTGPQNRAVGLIAAGYSSNRARSGCYYNALSRSLSSIQRESPSCLYRDAMHLRSLVFFERISIRTSGDLMRFTMDYYSQNRLLLSSAVCEIFPIYILHF